MYSVLLYVGIACSRFDLAIVLFPRTHNFMSETLKPHPLICNQKATHVRRILPALSNLNSQRAVIAGKLHAQKMAEIRLRTWG